MDEERINILADKWLKGTINAEESQELEAWYTTYDSIEQQVNSNLTEEDFGAALFNLVAERGRIKAANKKVHTLWPRIAAAVAVLLVIGAGWFYYGSGLFGDREADGRHPELVSGSPYDIAPGKNTATLTLTDGAVINLSDTKTGVVIDTGKLTYNDGSLVQNSSGAHFSGSVSGSSPDVQQRIVLSTPRGGTYKVVLPDGTKVWLNAASSLKFPSTFSGMVNRKVDLIGEAYFEVYKNKNKPFLVNTGEQQVQVLGTHFNINAYNDKGWIKTTLLEGSVKVGIINDAAIDKRTGLLKPGIGTIVAPGQQAEVLYGQPVKLIQANLEEAMAWKNGMFIFNDEDIESVMKKVARWYDVEVVYEGKISKDGFNGMISRDKNISQVLLALEKTKGVHFKIKGRRVIVTE